MLLWLLACVAPDPELARLARLRDALRADNAAWLSRDHALLEDKLDRMAADPFDFLRGSAGWYWSELARPDPERAPTTFLADPEALGVLVVGDLHLENAGTCLPVAEPDPGEATAELPLRYEVVDLDGAAFGPWALDTRRTALSLALVADTLDGCDPDCRGRVITRFAEAYADEIAVRAAGGAGWDAGALGDAGRVLAGLEARARADGAALAELADHTRVEDGERRLATDDTLDATGDGLLPLTAEESAQLDRLLAAWPGRPPGFRRLDAARRFGAGVASLPAVRYAVLWDSGDGAWADDRLLNVREVVDPPALPGLDAGVGTTWGTLAERVDAVAAATWSVPGADPLYGAVADGGQTFKVTSWSGWFQEVDHGDLITGWLTGELGEPDLGDHAATLGRVLAGAHARGPLAVDPARRGAALPVIAAELDGRADALVAERVRDAEADLAALRADHAGLLRLREVYGPLAGIDAVGAE